MSGALRAHMRADRLRRDRERVKANSDVWRAAYREGKRAGLVEGGAVLPQKLPDGFLPHLIQVVAERWADIMARQAASEGEPVPPQFVFDAAKAVWDLMGKTVHIPDPHAVQAVVRDNIETWNVQVSVSFPEVTLAIEENPLMYQRRAR